MKNFIKLILIISISSSLAIAKEDPLVTGCKDIMKNRASLESGYVIGYLAGHNILGRDTLNAMELKTFQSLDFKDAKKNCKRLLTDKSAAALKYPQYMFSMYIRGDLARANGHEWDEVQERKNFMRKASGFEDTNLKENKKY